MSHANVLSVQGFPAIQCKTRTCDSGVPSAERQSFLKLTRELASLPLDQSAAALETSAAIAGISLRAGIEFLRAAPAAAEVLQAAELRAWGELGRRLAMGDVETAITFFAEGVSELKDVPDECSPVSFPTLLAADHALVTHCDRNVSQRCPRLAKAIDDPRRSTAVLEVAAEISRRSAKHSAEFLKQTPEVLASLAASSKIRRSRKRASSWRRSLLRAPAASRRTRGQRCRRHSRISTQTTR